MSDQQITAGVNADYGGQQFASLFFKNDNLAVADHGHFTVRSAKVNAKYCFHFL
jgi:hypothetical protein